MTHTPSLPTRRRCLSGPAILLTALVVLAVQASDARAGSNNYLCEYNEVCLYSGTNWTGQLLADRSRADLEYWGGYPLPGWAVNLASSFKNRTTRYFCLYAYEHPNSSGWILQPSEWGNISWRWNDQVDGIKVC